MSYQTIHGSLPIVKGQAYRYYFWCPNPTTPNPSTTGNSTTFAALHQISLDGGAFVNLTNTVQFVGNGLYYVDLVSAETNADLIVIVLRDTTNSALMEAVMLYTVPSELTSIPVSTDPLSRKLLGLFQYFFNKRTTTTSAQSIYKSDSTTVLGTATVSDDGTTVTKGKLS